MIYCFFCFVNSGCF